VPFLPRDWARTMPEPSMRQSFLALQVLLAAESLRLSPPNPFLRAACCTGAAWSHLPDFDPAAVHKWPAPSRRYPTFHGPRPVAPRRPAIEMNRWLARTNPPAIPAARLHPGGFRPT